MTTADSPNRLRDKARVESQHPGLSEEGRPDVKFYCGDTHIATGYIRVVYGDHGPYIEFAYQNINWDLFEIHRKSEKAWYDEAYMDSLMLYLQKKPVNMLPNPPVGKYSVRNNRPEGYADYRVGMVYVDPDVISIK